MTAAYRFVLCRSRDPKNVAAAHEALFATGAGRLVVAEPAGEVLTVLSSHRRISIAETLDEAIAGADLVVGFTRRWGQRRKPTYFTLEHFACWMRERTRTREVALVFGNETSGLTDDELLSCHLAVTIPTLPACPSLNLSHAAALVGYVLTRESEPSDEATQSEAIQDEGFAVGAPPSGGDGRDAPPVSTAELDTIVADLIESVRRAGYLVQDGPQGMRLFLHDLLGRVGLTAEEAEMLRLLFSRIAD